MKAFRIENGKMVAYVHRRDIEILKSISDFIDQDLFQEKSIVNGACNKHGYYRITCESNIRYLKGLPFIPNYDYLVEMDCSALARLQEKNGIFSQEINAMFVKDECLSSEDIDHLKNIASVSKTDLILLKNASTDEEANAIKFAIWQQLRCYGYSVCEMIHQKELEKEKEDQRQEEAKKEARKKALQKVFKWIK